MIILTLIINIHDLIMNFQENMLFQYVEMNLNFKFFTLLDSRIETF
jgi:hypothetical protein